MLNRNMIDLLGGLGPGKVYPLLISQFYDCAGFNADDLVVEIEESHGVEFRPCESCTVVYVVKLIPQLDAQSTSADRGAAVVIAGVQSGLVAITARERTSGRNVERFEVPIVENHVHGMGVAPLTGLLFDP